MALCRVTYDKYVGKPRNINTVSIGLTLLTVAAIYFGWKFGRVYWQAHQVDNAMDKIKYEAAELNPNDDDERGDQLLRRVTKEVTGLGVDDPNLAIYFDDNYTSIHVDYEVTMEFLFGVSKTMKFKRKVAIPQEEL